MHHEEEQSDRIDRLEQEQRQLEQRKCGIAYAVGITIAC